MDEVRSKSPAARGRIIRRLPEKRSSGPALRELTVESLVAAEREQGARRFELGRFISSFILAPAVFGVSAVFMWTQPFEASGAIAVTTSKPAKSNVEHVSRIGREYARQFSVEAASPLTTRTEKVVKVEPRAVLTAPTLIGGVTVVGDRRAELERQVYKILKRYGKPIHNGRELSAAIVREALAQGYDPMFVAAVIKSESAFNAFAKSHKGAQGLMQIMPRTGAWLADQAAIPRGRLTDPGHNLKLGITYLKQLEGQYGGNRVLTLIAYNWGPGHVESASTGRRRVPGEVMQYAIKILNDYRRWSSEIG